MDTYLKQYFWTFHLLLLTGAAFFCAQMAQGIIAYTLYPPVKELLLPSSLSKVSSSDRPQKIDTRPLLERNLFSALREDIKPKVPSSSSSKSGDFSLAECVPSSLSSKLVGTLVSKSPEASVAVFIRDTEKPEALHVGEQLEEEVKIMAIHWGSVTVNRGGSCEKFSLEDKKTAPRKYPTAPKTRPSSKPPKMQFGENVVKKNDSEYEIPKSDIDKIFSNLQVIATQARVVPSFKDGKSNGFKLYSIKPGSLYKKIGIQNGDIIQRINGLEINSMEKAMGIYAKLKDASEISVDLIRRGKEKSMNYSIR